MSDPVRDRIAQVEALARDAFARHTLAVRYAQGEFRGWRCQRPGSWSYGFDVGAEPGRIWVMGDIGCLVLERERDMVAWLSGAVRDPQYMAGKAVPEIETEEFDADCAERWVREHLDEDHRLADRIAASGLTAQDLIDTARQQGEHEFYRALYELGESDMPRCRNFTAGFLWQREALKTFLRLLGLSERG